MFFEANVLISAQTWYDFRQAQESECEEVDCVAVIDGLFVKQKKRKNSPTRKMTMRLPRPTACCRPAHRFCPIGPSHSACQGPSTVQYAWCSMP